MVTNADVRGLLEAKFAGLEGAVLDWQAGKLVKACQTAEDAELAVEGLSLQKLVEGYGDYRATQASQSAVANYRRELERAEGAIVEPSATAVESEPSGEEAVDGVEDAPAWVRALLEQNRALAERMETLEGARVRETRGATYGRLLEGLPESIRRAYERVSVEGYSESEFEALCDEVRAEVGTIERELRARGGRIGFPPVSSGAGGSRELPSAEESEAFLAKMDLRS